MDARRVGHRGENDVVGGRVAEVVKGSALASIVDAFAARATDFATRIGDVDEKEIYRLDVVMAQTYSMAEVARHASGFEATAVPRPILRARAAPASRDLV